MPRKRLFCQENDTRSGRRFACSLPMVPCGSSPVTRFALASATRKTKRLRRRLGSEAAQWNAYRSVIKAQKSYQKACITEGLSLIKDHNEWSFQSQIKTQDLSCIDGCLLIFLWLTLSYAQRHWLTLCSLVISLIIIIFGFQIIINQKEEK